MSIVIAITFVDSSGSMQAFAISSLVRAITVNKNGIQNTEKAKTKSKVVTSQSWVNQGMSYGKGMESANNDARKWPILPFDVSRDFIISKEILA